MLNSHDDTTLFDSRQDRDLIASMNEASSFEELETLTKMARARLRRRSTKTTTHAGTSRLRRAFSLSL